MTGRNTFGEENGWGQEGDFLGNTCAVRHEENPLHRLIIKKVVELMVRSRNSKTIMNFPLVVFQLIS